jgi:HicB family
MSETTRYKYPLHLPESLKETATRMAREDGVSLNQWIVTAVAQKIGAVDTAQAMLDRRAARAKPGALSRHLDRAPKRPPVAGDEI